MKITKFEGEYRWLSNFAPCSIKMSGVEYPSVEHAYQATKTFLAEERLRIWAASTPGKAKRLGKTVTLREDWNEVRDSIMEELLLKKFTQEPYQSLLLATGDAEIIEGNHWGDTYWGVCNGEGQNKLGIMIMEIRSDLSTLSNL